MLSATRSTVLFFLSMFAAMLCDSRDCYAQAAGDATVVYGVSGGECCHGQL